MPGRVLPDIKQPRFRELLISGQHRIVSRLRPFYHDFSHRRRQRDGLQNLPSNAARRLLEMNAFFDIA